MFERIGRIVGIEWIFHQSIVSFFLVGSWGKRRAGCTVRPGDHDQRTLYYNSRLDRAGVVGCDSPDAEWLAAILRRPTLKAYFMIPQTFRVSLRMAYIFTH